MVCSVRQSDGVYRYYRVPQVPKPRSKAPLGAVGLSIEKALPFLPPGATPAGGGLRARGVLCRQGTPGLGDLLDLEERPLSSIAAVVGLVGGAWLLSRYLR